MGEQHWIEKSSKASFARLAYMWHQPNETAITFEANDSYFGYSFTETQSFEIDLEAVAQGSVPIDLSQSNGYSVLQFGRCKPDTAMRIEYKKAIPLPPDSSYLQQSEKHHNEYCDGSPMECPEYQLYTQKRHITSHAYLKQCFLENSVIHVVALHDNVIALVAHDWAGYPLVLYFDEVAEFALRGGGVILPESIRVHSLGYFWEFKIWDVEQEEAMRIKYASLYSASAQ